MAEQEAGRGERIAEIAARQADPNLHPATCAYRDDHPIRHGDKGVLYPAMSPNGDIVLLCPDCQYKQYVDGPATPTPEADDEPSE